MSSDEVLDWVKLKESTLFAFLTGLLDSDGSIIITKDNRGKTTLFLDYYGSDKPLLEWVEHNLERLGYPSSLRMNKPEGSRTKKYGIVHRTDYWQLSTYGLVRVQSLLTKIRPLHPEKILKMELALSVTPNSSFTEIENKVQTLRSKIREQVNESVMSAQAEFLRTHTAKAE